MYSRGGQQVDRDRPVDRLDSAGRSRVILWWLNKIPQTHFYTVVPKWKFQAEHCHVYKSKTTHIITRQFQASRLLRNELR